MSDHAAVIGRSLVHIPAATRRHRHYPRYYTYTKHTNFLFHSHINKRRNAESNVFLLSSHPRLLLRVDVEFLRDKESKT